MSTRTGIGTTSTIFVIVLASGEECRGEAARRLEARRGVWAGRGGATADAATPVGALTTGAGDLAR
ncbi:MAG TPA: hypothetical protein VFY36_09825 [Solirubrobacteraceae bacterium]|nr:hypothetical protein [Solirubrobacteraceae bacterium]